LSAKSFLLSAEPHWKINRPGTHHHIPISAQSWIYEPHSLTQRLRSHFGSVNVNVLYHQWKKAFTGEQQLLALPHNQYALIREVLLSSETTPLLLARTVIPVNTLQGAQRLLSNLGNRPLGEVLFSYPKLQRMEMHITKIEPMLWTRELLEKISITQPIWGRRTVYAIQHRHMLVSEFFLPEIVTTHPVVL